MVSFTPSIIAFWHGSTPLTVLFFLLFAAIGSFVRWGLQEVGPWKQTMGTLCANLVSSFLLGLLIGGNYHPATITVVSSGFLGSLSTFSTVMMQTTDRSSFTNCFNSGMYLFLTIALGIISAVIGLEIGSP